MSAMESLLKTVLNVSGVDIEEVKWEVTTRIAAFEANVETLNSTLIQHHEKLASIEKNLEALFAHLGLAYIKSEPVVIADKQAAQ